MKNIKEVIFFIVFVLVILIIMAILFFEFIPSSNTPDALKYDRGSSTAKLLSQISEEQQLEADKNTSTSILTSYEVTGDDIITGEVTKTYVKGKNHPFADYKAIRERMNETNSSIVISNSTNGSTTSDIYSSNITSGNTSQSVNTTQTTTLRETGNTLKASK